MTKLYRILAIIPQVEQTKIAVFHNDSCIYKVTIEHNRPFMYEHDELEEQIAHRKQAIIERLHDAGINLSKLHAVTSIGGMMKPVEGGTYSINEKMVEDLKRNYNGKHVSNLGALIAFEIAKSLNIDSFIVDPPVVNELNEEATFTGVPSIKRRSVFHALNQKLAARLVSAELHRPYDRLNLIVAHLGMGITIGAHHQGKIIDVNDGLLGEGPFSIERAGTLPLTSLISLCFSGQYSQEELIDMLSFKSGLKAYFQTDDLKQIIERIQRDGTEDAPVIRAMTYQIAKEIGSMAAVLKGEVDGIVLTGILAEIETITWLITERVSWISDVFIFPGEHYLQALNEGTLRVLRNEEEAKVYA